MVFTEKKFPYKENSRYSLARNPKNALKAMKRRIG